MHRETPTLTGGDLNHTKAWMVHTMPMTKKEGEKGRGHIDALHRTSVKYVLLLVRVRKLEQREGRVQGVWELRRPLCVDAKAKQQHQAASQNTEHTKVPPPHSFFLSHKLRQSTQAKSRTCNMILNMSTVYYNVVVTVYERKHCTGA